MPDKPRRRTPAEADALVAHLGPAERRRQIDAFIALLRARGVEVAEIFDAAGRSFLKVDLDQVRAKAPALAEAMERLQPTMPEPILHKPGVA